jgi:hypothetical protein
MSNDNDRKDYRRKKFTDRKTENKKRTHEYEDFSYSKIKNQFKQKRRSIIEQDYEDEIEDYYK